MIHIDLWLPTINRKVECFCDEQLEISVFMKEILGLLPSARTACLAGTGLAGTGPGEETEEAHKGLCLCDLTTGSLLEKGLSLSQNAVYSGHRLMLL